MNEKDSETPVNTFQELDDCETELVDVMRNMKELNETYNREFKELQQKLKSTLKEMKRQVSKFKKSVKKNTKKRNKNAGKPNKSGFNEPQVPKLLEKFIGKELLDETEYEENDSKLSRTKVFSLWQKKLKEEGCKDGKTLIINSKVAKALKLKKGAKFNFSEQHKLLATFYPPKNKSDNV